MSGTGMLRLFSGKPISKETTEQVVREGLEDGRIEIVDAGPPAKYRLTQAGIDYVEQEILPSLGVTPEEAKAWLEERTQR